MTAAFHKRYAIYFCLPQESDFQHAAAAWLGWDVDLGEPVPCVVREEWVTTPRKYGFHATLKPPFKLKEGTSLEQVKEDLRRSLAQQPAFSLGHLEVRAIGRFLALMPMEQTAQLEALAAVMVSDLDRHRAAPTEKELMRRRAAALSEREEALLQRWGYPYVMERFKFHMTLTGALDDLQPAQECAEGYFSQFLKQEIKLTEVALCGERQDGSFEIIERFSLS